MDKVAKIGQEIREMSETELAAFRKWFRDFDAESWDRQIEDDVQAGNLDALANQAVRDYDSGKCREM